MATSDFDDDSPLSITASIAGILTFLVAVGGAIWFRINSLRSADVEYERVKTALKWYKTESEWINDLISSESNYRKDQGRTTLPTTLPTTLHLFRHSPYSSGDFDEPLDRRLDARFGTPLDPINGPLDRLRRARGRGGRFREEMDDGELETYNERLEAWRKEEVMRRWEKETLRQKAVHRQRETGMYLSVLEQLTLLEKRLLELITAVEAKAEDRVAPSRARRRGTGISAGLGYLEGGNEWGSTGWRWMPGSWGRWGVRTEIAVQWLPVRTKALELVRQREALGSRVLFAQNALLGGRLGGMEERGRRQDERIGELMEIVKELSMEKEEDQGGTGTGHCA